MQRELQLHEGVGGRPGAGHIVADDRARHGVDIEARRPQARPVVAAGLVEAPVE